MAFQLTNPTVICFDLPVALDPAGEAKISFRQARIEETQVREQEIFGPQSKEFTDTGLRLRDSVPWSVRQEVECRLTIAGAEHILDQAKKPLFQFKEGGKLAMSAEAFHGAWIKLSPSVAELFHGFCLDSNPDWDFRPSAKNPVKVLEIGEGE